MSFPTTARTARLVATALITTACCLGVAAAASAQAASTASPAVTHTIADAGPTGTTPWGPPYNGVPTV